MVGYCNIPSFVWRDGEHLLTIVSWVRDSIPEIPEYETVSNPDINLRYIHKLNVIFREE